MATTISGGVRGVGVHHRIGVFGVAVAFMLFYMIAFPKGGIKFRAVPLTIGYAFTPLLALFAMARGKGLSLPVDRLIVFLPCAALTMWSMTVVYINGSTSSAATISYFVTILYLPVFGLITFSALLLDDQRHLIERTFVWAIRFIVIYGIFLFVFRQVTGKWIEIPYITVNAADVGQLDDKYIRRGIFFKLISTYNNGNLFGISVLIMAPLYMMLEKKWFLRGSVYLALFLTLSRTVWIGMFILLAFRLLSRGVKASTVIYGVFSLLFSIILVAIMVSAMGRDISFIFDSHLGGRADQLFALTDVRIIPYEAFPGFPEIVYLGVVRYFGIPGLLLFIAYLVTPALVLRLEGVPMIRPNPAGACMQGMLIYVIVACADAAFGLIPVMMVFWMIAGMGFWYAHHQARLEGRARAVAG